MKALFIGAHTDEELCFAGAIQHFRDCHYVACSKCDSDVLEQEFKQSCGILNVSAYVHDSPVRRFEKNMFSDFLFDMQNHYDTLFTHSIHDAHPDHRIVAEESIRVWKKNLLTYIGPWNGLEDSNYFVELTEEQLEKKIAALACYKSQQHRTYMDTEFIRSWARYNGIKCGKLYAEGFKVVRLVQSL